MLLYRDAVERGNEYLKGDRILFRGKANTVRTWTIQSSTQGIVRHLSNRYHFVIIQAVMCLRRIEDLLGNIDKVDRKKFCKTDYENCISQLQGRPQIWNPELHEVALEIMYRYFDSVSQRN